jgi:hypothetical protein
LSSVLANLSLPLQCPAFSKFNIANPLQTLNILHTVSNFVSLIFSFLFQISYGILTWVGLCLIIVQFLDSPSESGVSVMMYTCLPMVILLIYMLVHARRRQIEQAPVHELSCAEEVELKVRFLLEGFIECKRTENMWGGAGSLAGSGSHSSETHALLESSSSGPAASSSASSGSAAAGGWGGALGGAFGAVASGLGGMMGVGGGGNGNPMEEPLRADERFSPIIRRTILTTSFMP